MAALTAAGVADMMYDTMGDRLSDRPEALAPAHRDVQVSFRLTTAESETLRAVAERASVGPSTMARLIVVRYLAEHEVAPARRRAKAPPRKR